MKYLSLIGAALALAFTDINLHAQTFTPPPAPVTATSAQVTAQIAALGITLPSDQSVATIRSVNIGTSFSAPLATPVVVRIGFAPNTSGVIEQESYPATTAQVAAAIAAGPTLPVASPVALTIFNQAGTFKESAR
jgi:hypothetical protein